MKWYFKVLKNYVTFKGRARRSEYWYFILFSFVVSIILNVIGAYSGAIFLGTAYSIAVLLPSLAVGVRRMHDVNKSGWFVLIPFYNLILACTDGTAGDNEYGQDPKRPEYEQFLQEEPA